MTEKDYDVALSKLLAALTNMITVDGRLQLLEFDPSKIEHKLLWKMACILKSIYPKITLEVEMGFFKYLQFSKGKDWIKRVRKGERVHEITCRELLKKVRCENNYSYTLWEDIYESFYRN